MSDIKVKLDLSDGENTIEFDRNKLMEVNSISQMTGSPETIKYGSISNTGNFTINDYGDEIKEKIKSGLIDVSGVGVSIYEGDNLIQRHITKDSDYNTVDKTFSVELTNKLLLLDTLKYKGYVYQDTPVTVYALLFDVLNEFYGGELTEEIYKDILGTYMQHPISGGQIKIWNYAQEVTIKYPSIGYGKTYREVIDELCTILQCYAYVNDNDDLVFVSSRPLFSHITESDAIRITQDKMYSPLKDKIILRNKYGGVEINENISEKKISYSTVLTSPEINTYGQVQQGIDSSELNSGNYDCDYGAEPEPGSKYRCGGAYVKIKNYYIDGTFSFMGQSSDGLKKVIEQPSENLFDNDGNARFSLKCNYYEGSASGTINTDETVSNVSLSLPSSPTNIFNGYLSSFTNEEISVTYSPSLISPSKATAAVHIDDDSQISVSGPVNGVYTVTYHILVGHEKVTLSGTKYVTSISPVNITDATGSYLRYEPLSVTISVYGNVREIVFTESSANTENIDSATTIIGIPTGRLVQDKTRVGATATGLWEDGIKITSVIKSNILNDYNNGIADATVTVCCGDFYNILGQKVVDWSQGEVLQVGQIVFFTGDKNADNTQRYWTITGRRFYWEGSPYCDLELRQVIKTYSNYVSGLYDEDMNLVSSWQTLLLDGYIQVSDNLLSSVDTSLSGVLVVDDSIQTIGQYAFDECVDLTKIILPQTLTTIQDGAFFDCDGLVNMEIPSSVTSIGSEAFFNCAILNEINIPQNVTYIGSEAFGTCYHLDTVVFEDPNGWVAGSTPLSANDLSNTSTAATYLTQTYWNVGWTKT